MCQTQTNDFEKNKEIVIVTGGPDAGQMVILPTKSAQEENRSDVTAMPQTDNTSLTPSVIGWAPGAAT